MNDLFTNKIYLKLFLLQVVGVVVSLFIALISESLLHIILLFQIAWHFALYKLLKLQQPWLFYTAAFIGAAVSLGFLLIGTLFTFAYIISGFPSELSLILNTLLFTLYPATQTTTYYLLLKYTQKKDRS